MSVRRPFIWIVACLLCLAGAWLFWPREIGRAVLPHRLAAPQRGPTVAIASNHLATAATNGTASAKTNEFAYRLSNTTKSLNQLLRDRHAILLENALMDSSLPLALSIPKNLQSQGDPGAYIVQARGPIDAAFRALLAQAGAQIVAYIPNNAYLVRAPAGVANGLTGNPLTQSVTSYEPYYKISSSMPVTAGQKTHSAVSTATNTTAGPSLLELAVKQLPLPAGTYLTLGLFKDGAAATVTQIEKLGGRIVARDNSPFGPVLRVQPPKDWTALATLPGVQIVEPLRQRIHANDLSRATVGVAADTQTSSNYLNLSGKNVLVEVNDSGIDATHPDFSNNHTKPVRVVGDLANQIDYDGHGTHVAGTIAGDGSMSYTVTNAQGSIMNGTNTQFRGMATNATLLSMDWNESDQYLQEAAAQTNALISNNSWNYVEDYAYDLAAASYDAAVRDALPEVTGSQPVLFVFSAGNDGNGQDDGTGGTSDTILSPATAKNVITVGAIEQLRSITNIVTDRDSNSTAYWKPETDTAFQVAKFSSRGNVGVGTEGTYGRFKPDVVAPGIFVVSTRSSQWNQYAYYNPTNYHYNTFTNQVVDPNTLNNYSLSIPANTIGAIITIQANDQSATPFPTNLPIYVRQVDFPATNNFDFVTWSNAVSIPPNSGGIITSIQEIQNSGFFFAVGNTNNSPVNYNLTTIVITTNDLGNYFQVLSNLNQSIGTNNPASNPTGQGPYYRYESGTSMSAADVSGVLALMQDYFTNVIHAPRPSPALLKALLINGARSLPNYSVQVTNTFNFQGWGLINLPNTLPPGITNKLSSACASFYMDQSPTNALATGDSYTYSVVIPDGSDGQLFPLQVTLAWTDPPGDPAAAIKLVNSLELVVTNLDDPANPIIYYGNDSSGTATNAFDPINNVQNVFIPALLGSQYSVTVIGRSVNVNAVTAHTNNVVQDYALVISCGEGEVTNAFTVMDIGAGLGFASYPTTDQQITYVTSTNNAPWLNQFVGASTPLLGTNQIELMAGSTELNGIQLDPTNLPFVTNIITLGMTNQWHFYVVTNTGANSHFTNAAFITFNPDTLSVPRMGVFAGSIGNATRPEADIDLYVSRNSALTNLDPTVISNADKSVGRGGTEFVYYTDSAPGDVYYVGVYSEDQEASEYGFMPIFTDIPFSQPGPNGSQIVNGLALPVIVPDGSPLHPGVGYVFALAIDPMQVKRVVVTNNIMHQNFGDLIGTLTHSQQTGLGQRDVLNNHDSLHNASGLYTNIYDDSGFGDIVVARASDGPGSLNKFVGQQAIGPWILTEVDDALTHTGAVTGFQLLIEPHQDLSKGIQITLGPFGWFYDYIDVPPGTASLTVSATNLTAMSIRGLVNLYINSNSIPTLANTNEWGPAGLTNGTPPGNSITISSPPPGRYWVGLSNGSVNAQTVYLIANITMGKVPGESIFSSAGPVPILDDAVTTDFIDVPANQTISSMEVALRVDHPRVSDLVFHLISPSGTRVLLVENRGGTTTQGMGSSTTITNIVPVTSSGNGSPSSTVINLAINNGTLTIYYNFYQIPDEMVVQDQTGAQIFDSGQISGSGVFNIGYTNSSFVTITMNPTINEGTGDLWDYTVNALQSRQAYLVLTEDTNKTTTPIKFAPTPFVPYIPGTTNASEWHGSFEGNTANNTYSAGSYFPDGWLVDFGTIDVNENGLFGLTSDEGAFSIDLDGSSAGGISTNIATVAGQNYTLSFAYARNPDSIVTTMGHPPFIPQANVLINGNTIAAVVANKINSWASLNWQTTSVVFTATSSLTHLAFASGDDPSSISGVLLDCVDLTPANLNDGFENTYAGDYVAGTNSGFGGWTVTTNQVTVISNASLAYSGTNLLALADGTISRILPTTPGTTYTLSYAYRGPGAFDLWRGQTNALDSVGTNNGTLLGGAVYATGEVGKAFSLDGSSGYVNVPDSPSLDSLTSSITVELWMKSGQLTANADWMGLVTKGNNSWRLQPLTGYKTIYWWLDGVTPSGFSGTRNVNDEQWHHVAATYDGAKISLYVDGTLDTSLAATGSINLNSDPVCIGANSKAFVPSCGCNELGYFFNGLIDEVSIYSRALSASEIQAIYQKGSAGKYDTNYIANTNVPFAQGLAEAQLTLNGAPQPIFFANNTNWQTATISFTATSTNTPLQIAGLEPGMLLDQFVMTTIPTNNYDLYYLPEQSLDTVQGENAMGEWQLEIQDDRAGAMNPAPSLVSWQLRFNFNYTPPTIPTLTNTQVIAGNTVPAGGIAYFEVIVPTNADISTNFLLNVTPGPLNLLFDFANPPTGTAPPDYLILSAPTGTGSAILTTTSVPTNFAAGGTYYLGVQNLNNYAVNYNIQVNFHLVPPPLSLPPLPELLAITNQLFTVTNAATGGLPPLTYATLTSTVPGPNVPVIDANGVITWTPDGSQAPAVYTLTNIVNDSATPPQWATNIFHVLVVLTNGQPAFPGAEGAGGFAIGGRGGDVYHVVNLNDSGPGSLRNGIVSTFGSRTIVFDVSGTINLYSPLQINNPYITIAGQTAPGAGITLQGLTFSVESAPGTVEHAHDAVVRFLRCRPGDIYAQYYQGDSFHFFGVTNSIADHLSASWSLDDLLSTTYSTNVTVQWSMIAQPLDHSTFSINNGLAYQEHGYGSLIRYGSGQISYLHNLYADNYSQSPEVGDNIQLDFINNVVCNWGVAAGTNEDNSADDHGSYTNYLNYSGNYFIAGSNSANPGLAFDSGVPSAAYTLVYQSTNFIDTNAFNSVLDGTNTLWDMFSGNLTQLASAILTTNGIAVATNDPAFNYEQVLAFAGATVAGPTAAGSPAAGTSLLRDPVDTNIVANVRSKSGQIVDFISSNSFAGVYLSTNFGVTYSGYTNAAAYWVANGFTSFVGVNPWPVLDSAPQPLDSDGDGIPDYWEITLLATGSAPNMNPAVPNNNHMNPDGYTDLEHYLNWLAAPHALTVSNTPVDVDLYAVVGRTGNLIFDVGNPTNGTVTLGVDGHTATFMPTNNYFGFASFDFSVTNLATTNGFDVTVSVMVSVTNITTSSLPLTNAVPETNTIPAGSFTYYLVTVPSYAQLATNILSNVSGGPLNLWFSQVGFPTGTNAGDYILLANSTGGISLLGTATNFIPTNIIAGGTYYLGVQNLNGGPVNFGIEVDFYPPPPIPPPPPLSLVITITSITYTNGGFLLQWQGPTNYLYQIQWTTNLAPAVWDTVLNPVINTTLTLTNGHYSWFDDGTLTGGPAFTKFYRIIASANLGPINGPGPATNTVLPGTMSQGVVAVPINALWASNVLLSATGPLNVWLNPTNAPVGDTNAGDFLMLSATNAGVFVLTSNSVPPLVPGTDYYLGFQNPGTSNVTFIFEVAFGLSPPSISSITLTTNGLFQLQWTAPTNYQFQVEWTTNLLPPVTWNYLPPGPPWITSTNVTFTFVDTNAAVAEKFYRLIQQYP